MRLIDADKLLEETRKDRDYAEKNGFLDMYYERQVLIDRIESQPTAYDVDKLVEWLEELKAIKSAGFTDDLLNMGFTKGYSKAIDDFLKEICKMIVQSESNGNYRFYAVEIKQSIADLAEQLKASVENERY